MAELKEEEHVVNDLEDTADDEWQRPERCGEEAPGRAGLTAAAKLRGTDVKLAAAALSASVTTAIT